MSPYRGYCSNCPHCKQEMELLPSPNRKGVTIGIILTVIVSIPLGWLISLSMLPKKVCPQIKITASTNGYVWQNGEWVQDSDVYDQQQIHLTPYEHDGVVDFRSDTYEPLHVRGDTSSNHH